MTMPAKGRFAALEIRAFYPVAELARAAGVPAYKLLRLLRRCRVAFIHAAIAKATRIGMAKSAYFFASATRLNWSSGLRQVGRSATPGLFPLRHTRTASSAKRGASSRMEGRVMYAHASIAPASAGCSASSGKK